ncbi:glycoside hydrolase family 36 N-terminal domain-containing protein [Pedobacter panaciterrae]
MRFKTHSIPAYASFAMLSASIMLNTGKLVAQTIIPIETQNNALILQADTNKDLGTVYFGKKLSNTSEYGEVSGVFKQTPDYTGMLNSAYTASGSRNLLEPAITVTHADGNNSLDLKYVSHDLKKVNDDVSLLSIVLKDPAYNFTVTLYYKTYYKEDVVEQWSSIKHNEKGNVTLHKYASANLHIKSAGYYLNQYHGDWAKEMQSEESKLTHGIKTLDTKLGTRANLFQPSVFMVSLNKPSNRR